MLVVDRKIDCRKSDDYEPIRSFAIAMIVLLPVSLMLCAQIGLWRLRGALLEVDDQAEDARRKALSAHAPTERADSGSRPRRASGIAHSDVKCALRLAPP